MKSSISWQTCEITPLTQISCRYPVVSAIDAKPSRILLVVVVALHAGLAIAIKILFFAHGSPVSDAPATPSDPMQDAPKGDEGGEGKMMFF